MSLWKRFTIILELLLGLPKSIFLCFRLLPIKQAMRLPILVSVHCKLIQVDGKILLPKDKVGTGAIMIGVGTIGLIDRKSERSILELGEDSLLDFRGPARFGNGTRISCNGHLVFGSDFTMTGSSWIICHERIEFGANCLVSWKVEIMDTDLHRIRYRDGIAMKQQAIKFGSHVWVAAGARVLKGAQIMSNSVVAAGAIVTKSFQEQNVIIGGVPAVILKRNIEWER